MTSLTIGELAARSGVAASALRFYESRGLIRSTRSGGNQRRYDRAELSLDEIESALGTLPGGRTPTKADWARLSAAWRGRINEQIGLLERLRDRLTSCIGCGCLSLQRCRISNPDDVLAEQGPGPHHLLEP